MNSRPAGMRCVRCRRDARVSCLQALRSAPRPTHTMPSPRLGAGRRPEASPMRAHLRAADPMQVRGLGVPHDAAFFTHAQRGCDQRPTTGGSDVGTPPSGRVNVATHRRAPAPCGRLRPSAGRPARRLWTPRRLRREGSAPQPHCRPVGLPQTRQQLVLVHVPINGVSQECRRYRAQAPVGPRPAVRSAPAPRRRGHTGPCTLPPAQAQSSPRTAPAGTSVDSNRRAQACVLDKRTPSQHRAGHHGRAGDGRPPPPRPRKRRSNFIPIAPVPHVVCGGRKPPRYPTAGQ